MRSLLLFLAFFITSVTFSQQKKETLTVYFDSNSFEMSENEKNKLALFFTNPSRTVSSVKIDGFCDDVGTSASNLILSKKRARRVANYLDVNFKVKANKVSGKGEIQLLSQSEIEKARADHRKVTIAINYSVSEKSDVKTIVPVLENDSTATPLGYKTFDDVLEVGDKLIIENLVFKASQTVFENEAEAERVLKKIVAYFQKNPTVRFEINGHVCCISKSFRDAHDRDTGINNLSFSRAERVYECFLENGIARERMSYQGYGRQFPIPNGKESDNKRVEIVITRL